MPQDWAWGGADTLRIYVYGDPNNSAMPLSVKLEDSHGRSITLDNPDTFMVQTAEWQAWDIFA